MKFKSMIALAALGTLSIGTAHAGPELMRANPVRIGDKALSVDVGHAAPFVCDWDGDGRRDLLVGQMGEGRLRIYRNTGSNTAPAFRDFELFQAGESEGTVPSGWCVGFSPQVIDFDGDGHRDLLSGSWPGKIFLFAGTAENGFTAKRPVQDKHGKDLSLGKGSVAHVVDWDRDGDLDLVVGCSDGFIWWVPNESGDKTLELGSPSMIAAGGAAIHEPHSAPVVADWDGNGTLDLIVGQGDGAVTLYANRSRAGAPKLAAGRCLVRAQDKRPRDAACGQRLKPHVTDWNGDGHLDLLLGDYSMGPWQAPALNEEQKGTLEELQSESREVKARMRPMREEIGRRVLARMGYKVPKRYSLRTAVAALPCEQRRVFRARLDAACQAHEGVQALSTRLERLDEQSEPFLPAPTSEGRVWVLLRVPPSCAKGG